MQELSLNEIDFVGGGFNWGDVCNIAKKALVVVGCAAVGAAVGGAIAGPPGVVFGAAVGAGVGIYLVTRK